MLVFLSSLGQECKQIFAGMILVVADFSAYRPEIGMHVEEVHIYRDLDALSSEILLFIYFLDNHDSAVSSGSDKPPACGSVPNRHPVKPEHEESKQCQNYGQGQGKRLQWNEMQANEDK